MSVAEAETKIEAGYYPEFDNSKISPSPFQNRVFPEGWEELEETKEFVANLKAIGVAQSLVARPHPSKPDWLELVAGERRLRSSKLAGLETVPVRVMNLTDSQAADITVSENLQRQDLSPLETAKGIQILMDVCSNDIKAIASHYGKSERWVYLMAGINNLAPCWQKEAAPGGELHTWTPAHWGLIARFAKEDQEEFHGRCGCGIDAGTTTSELDSRLTRHFMLLKQAPWKLEDETLVPSTGSCVACDQRTDCQKGLFDDDGATEEDIEKNARCMNSECWREKMKAHIEAKVAETRTKYPDLVFCFSEYSYGMVEKFKDYKPFYQCHDYSNCKKSDKGALPALVLYGKGEGKVRWIKPNTRGSSSKPARKIDPETGKPEAPSLKERLDKLNKRRKAWVVQRVIDLIETPEGYSSIPPLPIVMLYACGFDTRHPGGGWGGLKAARGLDASGIARAIWLGLREQIISSLKYRNDEAYGDAKIVCEDIGINFPELEKQAEIKIPPSKALQKQMADKKKGGGK